MTPNSLTYAQFRLVSVHSATEFEKFIAQSVAARERFRGSNWVLGDVEMEGDPGKKRVAAVIRMNSFFRASPRLEGAVYLRDGFIEVEEWDVVSNGLCYSRPDKLRELGVDSTTTARLLSGCPRASEN
jgi:hypothetical protein